MLASLVLRASLVLISLYAIAAFGSTTVVTPYGERPSTGVHVIPDGAGLHHIGEEVHLIDANGHVLNVAPTGHTNAVPASRSASWRNRGTPIEYVEASWTVPRAPKTYHGQTIFIFVSLGVTATSDIMAPALQYGPSAAGGGPYWATAVWYVAGNTVYYTPLQTSTVSVGHTLNAIIEHPNNNGNLFNYFAAFVLIPGILPIWNLSQLVVAQVAVEAYNIKRRTDYVDCPITFHNISLFTCDGTPSLCAPSVHWTAHGPGVVVNVQGATNAKVTFI